MNDLSPGATLLLLLINLTWVIWVIYLIIKIAAHVGAWPF